MIKFLDLEKQYQSIKSDIDRAILSIIQESAFIGGTPVAKFEEHFAAYQQVRHCIGVANGTDALEIAIESLSMPPGSEVLVPANTFIASSEAVTRSGHRVVFCDCDPRTYTISPEDAERRITTQTRAIMPVHLYGHPCDMDSILSLSRKNNLYVIEDCAQAHGAEYKGHRVGAIGDIGTFSFYPGKNLGAFGDAGAIVTNNDDLAKHCRMISNHGRTMKYAHDFEGRNSRLDGLQAAILDVKLSHLDVWLAQRSLISAYYHQHLANLPGLTLPYQAEWAKHVWHLYVIRTQNRDDLSAYLQNNNIQTGIHYPIALPKQQAYAYLGQQNAPMVANKYDEQILSLPIGEHLDLGDGEIVTRTIRKFFEVPATNG
jgi:dTDP-4-amino-4,6-dideoxygalactose transaminase